MLTKEEYKDSLNELFIYSKYSANKVEIISLIKCYEKLEQLIEEHFDNPPLKFEELKARMWLWDNLDEEYIRVLSVDENSHYINYWRSGVYRGSKYLENRFYRKQVSDD